MNGLETIEPNVAANAAWARMQKDGASHLLVAKNGVPRGVLSERHLGGRDGGADIRNRRLVGDLMNPKVASVAPTVTLREAIDSMRRRQVGYLIVEEDGEPVGIVTASDVLDELGRDRLREPLPGWRPRPVKTRAGRRGTPAPAHIRMLGPRLSAEQRQRIREDLGAKLGKFGDSIERVTIRIEDVNGPRGGVDQVCRIKAVLSNLPSVVFESRDASLETAVGNAITGIEQAVRRKVQRRRMKPIQSEAQSQRRSRARA
jgi:CBS domain-containing protein